MMLHFAFLGRILWSVESSARNVHLFKGMDVFICVIECSVGCKMIS